MQTFLTHDNYKDSARVLDNKRLGKQRVEVIQILNALVNGRGWIHHPATHMWSGHINSLVQYGIVICEEWISRGFNDTCLEKIDSFHNPELTNDEPPWMGLQDFHESHRSNLMRKDNVHYGQYFNDRDDLPYCWPKLINGKWHIRFKSVGVKQYDVRREYVI